MEFYLLAAILALHDCKHLSYDKISACWLVQPIIFAKKLYLFGEDRAIALYVHNKYDANYENDFNIKRLATRILV